MVANHYCVRPRKCHVLLSFQWGKKAIIIILIFFKLAGFHHRFLKPSLWMLPELPLKKITPQHALRKKTVPTDICYSKQVIHRHYWTSRVFNVLWQWEPRCESRPCAGTWQAQWALPWSWPLTLRLIGAQWKTNYDNPPNHTHTHTLTHKYTHTLSPHKHETNYPHIPWYCACFGVSFQRERIS